MVASNNAARHSRTYSKYLDAPSQSEHVTIEEAEALGGDLAAEVRSRELPVDLVVGLANGAFLPAHVVARALSIPCEMVKVRRKGSRYKQRLLVIKNALRIPNALILWGPLRMLWVAFQNRTNSLESGSETFDFDVRGKHVLMVDDCVETGKSFHFVAERLRAGGAADVRTAVYCWSRMPDVPEEQSRPDVFLHRQIQFYPWSNNSKYLGQFYSWMQSNRLELWQ